MRMIDADALREATQHAAFIRWKDVEDAPTVGGWISVKDRLPEVGEFVLVAHKVDYGFGIGNTLVDTALFQPDGFSGGGYGNFLDGPCSTEVTHWMPLPEPPEEVSGDALSD